MCWSWKIEELGKSEEKGKSEEPTLLALFFTEIRVFL
jgi:hypothetical protein